MPRRSSEDELIARHFAPLAGPAGLGLVDDAAVLPASAQDMVATVDALVAGVHFFADDPPAAIAKKALRTNISDLAGKGAEPLGFLLALSLAPDWTDDWLAAFAAGLREDAAEYGCPLLGGDTTATPGPLTISITALGRTARFVPRTGAGQGESLYVSGTIGDAALGLTLRRDEALAAQLAEADRAHLLDRYLLPQPRPQLAAALRAHASAAMDVSDGLAGDLAKLARASGVGAVVEIDQIPLSRAARAAIALRPDLLETALTGGDDYEILCSVPGDGAAFEAAAGTAGVRVTRIGTTTTQSGDALFLDQTKRPIDFKRLSYRHF